MAEADACRSRDESLRALGALRARLPHVSQSALASVLREARNTDLTKLAGRKDIRSARDLFVNMSTPYGTVHQNFQVTLSNGRRLKVEYQNPQAMLYALSLTSTSFSRMIERSHDRALSSPTSPWGFVFYNDEVTPGNQLRQHNPRKLEAFYWSLAELGMHVLCDEEAWLEALVLQSCWRRRIVGGLSALTAALLRCFFGTVHNMETAGVMLKLKHGRTIHVWIALRAFLADESAMHMMVGCKGAGGLRNFFCARTCSTSFSSRTWTP